ncbi:MAG: PorP/SprF family type IX secretion system membrane protein [Flavobacteriales bacterium]|nr:PorP/SprF family type IX secretion system membrane protein [Flavobacteriales bacterium]
MMGTSFIWAKLIGLKIKLIICIGLTTSLITYAQDIHFSQFYQSPFNLNPAQAGQFDGAYRFVGNQRTQWRSVTTPYSTFGLSGDAAHLELPDGILNTKDGMPYQTKWNVGLSFYHDKAGDSQLKSTIIQLTLGQDFQMGNDDLSRISIAGMIGYNSMRIDYSALRYDNQWNGFAYDPGISSGENFPRDSRGYLNTAAGICWYKTWNRKKEMIGGISLMNISKPKQSFFNDGYVKLDTRLNAHGGYRFPIKNNWLGEPMILAMVQGTYREINFGGRALFVMNDKPWFWRSVYFGVFGRAKDAGYVVAGLQYDTWDVGISYDINTSNLKPASNGRGGFEISAVYIIPRKPHLLPVKTCPDYL